MFFKSCEDFSLVETKDMSVGGKFGVSVHNWRNFPQEGKTKRFFFFFCLLFAQFPSSESQKQIEEDECTMAF
jgi:hypothetical protein